MKKNKRELVKEKNSNKTKKCNKCGKRKSVNKFRVICKQKKYYYYYSNCIDCEAIRFKEMINLNQERIREYIWAYKSKNHCVDCGEKNPIVLQFDHRSDSNKISEVCNLKSLDKIKEEILKCDIRCANCHTIKTAKDFGWYKGQVILNKDSIADV